MKGFTRRQFLIQISQNAAGFELLIQVLKQVQTLEATEFVRQVSLYSELRQRLRGCAFPSSSSSSTIRNVKLKYQKTTKQSAQANDRKEESNKIATIKHNYKFSKTRNSIHCSGLRTVTEKLQLIRSPDHSANSSVEGKQSWRANFFFYSPSIALNILPEKVCFRRKSWCLSILKVLETPIGVCSNDNKAALDPLLTIFRGPERC